MTGNQKGMLSKITGDVENRFPGRELRRGLRRNPVFKCFVIACPARWDGEPSAVIRRMSRLPKAFSRVLSRYRWSRVRLAS